MLRLLCIRHAQSTWNALGRWQGHADPPLSEAGRLEAKALAEQLLREAGPLVGLVTSDLARARETAALLGEALGLVPEPWPALREMDVGVWSGRGREEIERVWPEDYARFRAGDPDLRPGGGESRRAMRARALAAVRALEQRFGAASATFRRSERPSSVPRSESQASEAEVRVAVVTHLGWLRVFRPGLVLSNAGTFWLDSAELAGWREEERP